MGETAKDAQKGSVGGGGWLPVRIEGPPWVQLLHTPNLGLPLDSPFSSVIFS